MTNSQALANAEAVDLAAIEAAEHDRSKVLDFSGANDEEQPDCPRVNTASLAGGPNA